LRTDPKIIAEDEGSEIFRAFLVLLEKRGQPIVQTAEVEVARGVTVTRQATRNFKQGYRVAVRFRLSRSEDTATRAGVIDICASLGAWPWHAESDSRRRMANQHDSDRGRDFIGPITSAL